MTTNNKTNPSQTDSMPGSSPSPRYRVRYSLRGLLLAMLACGILASTWSTFVEPFRRQANGINAIKDAGGLYKSVGAGDHTLQRWLVTVSLGKDAYCHVKSADLSASPIQSGSDFILRQIGQMPYLESLKLDSSKIDNGDISGIAGMRQLKSLSLRYTDVSDDALDVVSTLPSLETLTLTGNKVTDAGIRKLHKLKALRELYLRWTLVSAEGVDGLEKANPDCKVHSHTLAQ